MIMLKYFLKKIKVDRHSKKNSSLVLLGGNTGTGLHAEKIYKKMAELAGGNKGKIGVITSANDPYEWDCKKRGESTDDGCNDPSAKNSKMAANRYIKRFKQFGIKAEWIPIDLANIELADDKELANRILNGEYSGFFFGGGKQDQYTKVFYRRNKTGKRSRSAILQAILKQLHLES